MYGASLDPDRLEAAAPDAEFDRIAHLPEHRLSFSPSGAPVVVADEHHTVWGAVFVVPATQTEALLDPELDGDAGWTSAVAVDRNGERLPVEVPSAPDGGRPNETSVDRMLAGARHWGLPTGWVVGLEDLLDPFEF